MNTRYLLAVGALVASFCLNACADAPSNGAALADALAERTNMPRALADCIGALAEEELTENGKAFLVASMSKNEAQIEKIREHMSFTELTESGMFMVSAANRCDAESFMPN